MQNRGAISKLDGIGWISGGGDPTVGWSIEHLTSSSSLSDSSRHQKKNKTNQNFIGMVMLAFNKSGAGFGGHGGDGLDNFLLWSKPPKNQPRSVSPQICGSCIYLTIVFDYSPNFQASKPVSVIKMTNMRYAVHSTLHKHSYFFIWETLIFHISSKFHFLINFFTSLGSPLTKLSPSDFSPLIFNS